MHRPRVAQGWETPSSWKARRCNGVWVIMVNAGMSSAGLDTVGADGGQVGEQAGGAVHALVSAY